LAEVRHVPARVGSPAPLRDPRAHVTKEDAEAAAWRSRHGPVDVALPLFCDDRRKLRPGLFESGPQPFRSTIFPVKSGGLYHLSYRPTQGGLCPKRTRMERTGHPVARGGGRCSDKAGDWMSVWRPVASGSLWPLRVGLSPFQQRATGQRPMRREAASSRAVRANRCAPRGLAASSLRAAARPPRPPCSTSRTSGGTARPSP
jgi:hypothetical protein